MSDFNKYWQSLVDKNAGLNISETKLTISVESLKAQIKRAYESGEADQKKLHDALEKLKSGTEKPLSIFDQLFGDRIKKK